MSGRPRSLEELEATTPHLYFYEHEIAVHVTREEAIILHNADATIISGCSHADATHECQRYILNGKTYIWIAISSKDGFPIPSKYGEMLHQLAINAGD